LRSTTYLQPQTVFHIYDRTPEPTNPPKKHPTFCGAKSWCYCWSPCVLGCVMCITMMFNFSDDVGETCICFCSWLICCLQNSCLNAPPGDEFYVFQLQKLQLLVKTIETLDFFVVEFRKKNTLRVGFLLSPKFGWCLTYRSPVRKSNFFPIS
jgi:hypothetical protein